MDHHSSFCRLKPASFSPTYLKYSFRMRWSTDPHMRNIAIKVLKMLAYFGIHTSTLHIHVSV